MKTSVIRQRVADFLRQHAPFEELPAEALMELAGSGKVKFHSSEEYICQQGETLGDLIWVVQQGRLEILDESNGASRLQDFMGAGDIVGLDGLVGDRKARYSVRTASDVIVYGLSAGLFSGLAERHEGVERFLNARFSMAGWTVSGRGSWFDAEAPSEAFLRARAGRHPIVQNRPKMKLPVRTRTALQSMLQSGSSELDIVDEAGEIAGVMTAKELALFCGQDAVGLVKELESAATPEELRVLLKLAKRMIDAGLAGARDVDDCRLLGDKILHATVTAAIRIAVCQAAESGMQTPQVPYCWVLFGSAARGDLPQPVFPTLAAIYDDSATEPGPVESTYFVTVAGMSVQLLHECGLRGTGVNWPDGAQPGMPLSEWKRLFEETISDPLENPVYLRREFFDFEKLSGDGAIVEQLKQHIRSELEASDMAISMLANDTLDNVPPLAFFEGLVVDLDGQKRESFDIDATLLGPAADAARVFALDKRLLDQTGTLHRLEAAAVADPEAASVFQQAAEAFRIGLFHRTLASDSNVYPGRLTKPEQMLIKSAIQSVGQLIRYTVAKFVEGR